MVLKQGEPLAPFLFLLMVEGRSVSMKREIHVGAFAGFKVVLEGVKVFHF